jgi:hypothetical protein
MVILTSRRKEGREGKKQRARGKKLRKAGMKTGRQ